MWATSANCENIWRFGVLFTRHRGLENSKPRSCPDRRREEPVHKQTHLGARRTDKQWQAADTFFQTEARVWTGGCGRRQHILPSTPEAFWKCVFFFSFFLIPMSVALGQIPPAVFKVILISVFDESTSAVRPISIKHSPTVNDTIFWLYFNVISTVNSLKCLFMEPRSDFEWKCVTHWLVPPVWARQYASGVHSKPLNTNAFSCPWTGVFFPNPKGSVASLSPSDSLFFSMFLRIEQSYISSAVWDPNSSPWSSVRSRNEPANKHVF